MPTSLRNTLPRIFLLLSVFTLLLGACASARMPSSAPAEESMGAQSSGGEFDRSAPETVSDFNTLPESAERLVIKNAELSVVVADPIDAMDTISRMADEMGGYVVSANLYQSTLSSGVKVPRGSITVRVPAERLDGAIAQVESLSDQPPIRRNIDSQDVTSDYVDLQSRLRNLENTEAQLTEIMGSATKTEDVLSVYNRLVEVQEQIEVTKGRIQYYEQSAALSALSVELTPNEAVQPITIGTWQPTGVARDAVQALVNTMKFLANAAIWVIIYILPLLLVGYLIFVLPLRLLFRAWRRRRSKSETPAPKASS